MTREEIDRELRSLVGPIPGADPTYLDRIIALIAAAELIGYPNHLPWAYRTWGEWLSNRHELDEALTKIQLSIRIAKELGDLDQEAQGFDALGSVAYRRGEREEAFKYYQQGLDLCRGKKLRAEGSLLHDLAGLYEEWGLYDLAIETVRANFDMSNADQPNAYALWRIAELSSQIGDRAAARPMFERVVELTRTRDNYLLARALSELGVICEHEGDIGGAMAYFRESLEISVSNSDKDEESFCLTRLGACERVLKHYTAALEYLSKAIEMHQAIGRLAFAAEVLCEIASVRLDMADPDAAIEALEQARDHLARERVHFQDSDLNSRFAKAYEMRGEWQRALEYERLSRRADAALHSEQTRTRLRAAQVFVATERERQERERETMKREQLERELSNTTLQYLAQTEFLSSLRSDLLHVIRRMPPTDDIAKELRLKLKTLPCKSVDWKKFDTQFKAAHPEFTKQLLERHPETTPTELRICSLLRMQMRSTDIAQIFCVSERTIEHHRERMRKKFKLKRTEDLMKYVASI